MKGIIRFGLINIIMGASLLWILPSYPLTYLILIFVYWLIDLALIGWLEKINHFNHF